MCQGDAKRYRAVVARLNYMASDRPDIQFAVKEVARHMATPRESHWHAVTRIGKYVKGRPRLVLKLPWQGEVSTAVAYTDSDWAGCSKTAKSTSGGLITIGNHLIKSYSRQQKTVALSSAEAELHAMVAASAETLGIIGLCRDMGIHMSGEVYADSSAAIGITQRLGTGKVRHLRVQALWVQEVRCTGRFGYKKVLGTRSPADILTKHVPCEVLCKHLEAIGAEVRGGRAESAPTLDAVEAYTEEWTEESEEEPGTQNPRRRVHFPSKVEFRAVPVRGRGRPTRENKKTQRPRSQGGAAPPTTPPREETADWGELTKERFRWSDASEEEAL